MCFEKLTVSLSRSFTERESYFLILPWKSMENMATFLSNSHYSKFGEGQNLVWSSLNKTPSVTLTFLKSILQRLNILKQYIHMYPDLWFRKKKICLTLSDLINWSHLRAIFASINFWGLFPFMSLFLLHCNFSFVVQLKKITRQTQVMDKVLSYHIYLESTVVRTMFYFSLPFLSPIPKAKKPEEWHLPMSLD